MSPWVAAGLEAAPEAEVEGGEEAGAAQAAAAAPGGRTSPPRRRAVAPAAVPAEPDRQRGCAPTPRYSRSVPGAALQRLALVTMPGIVHRVELTMFRIQWRCTTSSGAHSVESTRWAPLWCAPDVRHRTGRRTTRRCPALSRAGRRRQQVANQVRSLLGEYYPAAPARLPGQGLRLDQGRREDDPRTASPRTGGARSSPRPSAGAAFVDRAAGPSRQAGQSWAGITRVTLPFRSAFR